jgi:hypothetical protein
VLRLQIDGRAHRRADAEATDSCVRERVVEGGERVRARDIEVELLVELLVGDGDPDSVRQFPGSRVPSSR